MSNQSFAHGYALLIGVGECAYTKWSLPATVKDAEAIQSALKDANLCAYSPANLRLLKDKTATRKGILEGLAWLKACAENDPEATVVIFYSGHGWLDKTSGGYYLIPSDTSPMYPAKTAFSATDLTTALQAIQAKRLLVIVDACHAAGMTTSKEGGEEDLPDLPEGYTPNALPKGLTETLSQGKGRAVFTSSSGEELSWVRKDQTMSIYTFHLIEALEGAGNRQGETLVKLSDLMGHLSQAVPETVRKECNAEQTPNFDFKTEDFPVAVLRGGKGLPSGGWQEVLRQKDTDARSGGVQANGERSVAIGGSANGSTIITGNGNTVGNGNIQVNNISSSSGIAIGHGSSSTTVNTGGGAYVGGNVHVEGGDFVGRDKISHQNAAPQDMAAAFELLYEKVEKQLTKSNRAIIKAVLQQMELQAKKGEQADEAEVQGLFQTLRNMAGDIFDVAVDTFSNPLKGISTVFRKIAQKAREQKS